MATIKSYTDISQSKKLAEILPLESADMEYLTIKETGALVAIVPFVKDDSEVKDSAYSYTYDRIFCWSLAALLELMPFQIIENNQRYGFYQWKGFNSQGETYCFEYKSNTGERLYETIHWNNPIDAAFEMVCWLLENGKL